VLVGRGEDAQAPSVGAIRRWSGGGVAGVRGYRVNNEGAGAILGLIAIAGRDCGHRQSDGSANVNLTVFTGLCAGLVTGEPVLTTG
jgi:hypothetical protein